ncbi:unnamed protein product [Vicia faba]|uniref:PB1-like domain-containing protein n=1 Tax=Vicia faba TaxID=3906 RepID=A0AAV1AKL5_VICFA|nr:unnamed protein product [Vicia faba]
MGNLVESPVKWYVDGLVYELDLKCDTDYMSYMDLENMIKEEGYMNIKCMWYWNPKYSFSRGLRPLNCDSDVLKLAEDIKGFNLVDVYVEHSIEVTHVEDNIDGCLNYVDDEVDSDVEITSNHDEAEVEVGSEPIKAEVEVGSEPIEDEVEVGSKPIEAKVEVGSKPIRMDDGDDDDDYIVSEGEISSSSHEDNEHDAESENVKEHVDLDWITVIHYDDAGDKAINSEDDPDFDVLHTPNESCSDEEQDKFPSFKSDSSKFELGMVFNNKEKVHEVVADYALKMKKNV